MADERKTAKLLASLLGSLVDAGRQAGVLYRFPSLAGGGFYSYALLYDLDPRFPEREEVSKFQTSPMSFFVAVSK